MVYALSSSYGSKQSGYIVLTKESYAQVAAELLEYETNVMGGSVKRSALAYAMGHKLPYPVKPLVFNCQQKASKFYNFMTSGAGILISETIVNLIEEMEPGVHQYFPVEFLMKSSSQPDQKYYVLNVCSNLKTLDFETSKVFMAPIPLDNRGISHGREYLVFPQSNQPKLVPPYDLFVKKSAFKGHVIWHEHGVQEKSSIYVTDEFYNRALELGDLGSLEILDYAEEI